MKLNYFAIPYLAVLAFMFGGILESGGIAWYQTLTLPTWNPPAVLVAIIWALIYVCAAWSLLTVWNTFPRDNTFRWVVRLFALTTALNLMWSLVFFYLHHLEGAVYAALLVGVSALSLMALVYRHSKKAGLLLLPYIVWVFFAVFLQYAVMTLN